MIKIICFHPRRKIDQMWQVPGITQGPGSATSMGRGCLLFSTWNDGWHIVGLSEGLCLISR